MSLAEGQIYRPDEGPDRRIVALFTSDPIARGSRSRVLYSTGGLRNRECSRDTFNRWIIRTHAERVGAEVPTIMERAAA